MDQIFKPTNKLFNGWTNLDQFKSIRVSLGCNPAFAREAEGEGVTCVAFPKYEKGGFAGTGGHAGFIVRFPLDDLLAAGFDENAIYFSEGARLGTRADKNNDNLPVCEDCVLYAEGSRELKTYKKIKKPKDPCWSCCKSIDESREED